MGEFYVYIIRCSDNSLYTGYTNDVENRLAAHKAGKGAKYLRGRTPLQLIYKEEFSSKSEAMKREAEIKSWSRSEKLKNLQLEL